MLERIFLKYLTTKGKVIYLIGLLLLLLIWGIYVLIITERTFHGDESAFIVGSVIINFIWAGVSYSLWRKPKGSTTDGNNTSDTKA